MVIMEAIKKICYLVIAHKGKEQLIQLVNALKTDNTDVFIHIDALSQIKNSDFDNENCIVLNNRIHGILFDYSLVEIELRLLRAAFEYSKRNNVQYMYYCLLSGQDFPLVSQSRIWRELQSSYPKAFIDCTPQSSRNWLAKRAKHITLYSKYYPKIISVTSHLDSLFLKKIIRAPFVIFDKLLTPFFSVQRQLDKAGISLYGGSQWWILPDIIVEWIIQECRNDTKTKYKIIHNIYGPDETFFQTLTMTGKFKGLIEVNEPSINTQNSKTFAYFNKKNSPIVGHPYVFTIEDKDLLLEKVENYFFARKFDSSIDQQIIDYIKCSLIEGQY